MSPGAAAAILPIRDGDPERPTAFLPSEESAPSEILRCAETLEIPWRRLLLDEIRAEQKLRAYRPDVASESLDAALSILSHTALRSFRVRDRIETLACQTRAGVRGALRRLRGAVRGLAGGSGANDTALLRHCRLAYHRILLLQRVRRAAARSRGTTAERLASVCVSARCSFEDAAWALGEEESPRRGRRMEAAVRKVRGEGFLVPRAHSEAQSFAELRRIVGAPPTDTRRRRDPRPA
ncbi:MAG TPA: hypothetical protein VKG23_09625 [Thermoanaerobaculia bacterium]|nr:hypothetical protein [Thermoanaerobaculia bacterium]